MSEDRKQPTAGFWITVALVAVLVGYPLSFGPACWITSRLNYGASSIPVIYRPICVTLEHVPSQLRHTIRWYAKALAAERWSLGLVEYDEWIWSPESEFTGVIDSVLY